MKWIYSLFFCFLFINTAPIYSDSAAQYLTDMKEKMENLLPLSSLKEQLGFSPQDIKERGKAEITAFRKYYNGGYYEGDPQDISGKCSYAPMDYKGQKVNTLYPCYLECIAPYVAGKDVLEIGPGRGCWTKAILSHQPKSVTCLDALSAESNRFWEFIGQASNVHYIQITDFSLSEIPDDSIDYVFSFGTFCHISPLLVQEYVKNLYPKLRSGAQCFIMYADYIKLAEYYIREFNSTEQTMVKDEVALYRKRPLAGHWYNLGRGRAAQMLSELGYKDICADRGANHRDPIMYFVKP